MRRHRRWLAVAAVLLACAAILALPACSSAKRDAGVLYQCPMHPNVIQDHPGDCPICGMRLVPMKPAANGAAQPPPGGASRQPANPAGRKILFYRNPMNPTVTSPVPAKDEMGMDYVPVYEDEVTAPTGGVEGHSVVQLSEEGLRLSGVQTAPAVRESLGTSIRAVGQVVPNEKLVRHIHTKIGGWVEHLFVNFTGEQVRRGQPLLSIYSQELLATQEEYLRARAAAARFSAASLPEVREGADDLVRAARQRLELFDVPPSLIAELDRTGRVQRSVTLVAPVSGFVTSKGIFEGQQVDPSMELYTVTDLSHVWIEADVYESEARKVKLGEPALLTSPYDPGLRADGKVDFIYPFLNPETRTLKVRFDFANPRMELKPAMYVNVALDVEPATGIVVPDTAIIDTGVRQLVFVDRGGGLFEPREVSVGTRSDGKARVLSGVAEGERVVVKANFLLDSESRLRAAIAAHAPATPAPQGSKP